MAEMKPMLAGKFDLDDPEVFRGQLAKLSYPLYGSPKIDGIRVLVHPILGAVTRKLKDVPNRYVYNKLSISALHYLDGEVTVGPPHTTGDGTDVFNRTTAIMAREGQPNFTYWIFDNFTNPYDPYLQRRQAISWWGDIEHEADRPPYVKLLQCVLLEDPDHVLEYEARMIEQGFEGIMLRHRFGLYKFGRSTLREQHLIKLKRTTDDDARIIGYEPRYQNQNTQERDNLGYAKRSAHQDNMVPLEMLGKFVVKSEKFQDEFSIGSGFDHSSATEWWRTREELIGRTITYKYQECGTIDRPRHPIFLRFRED